MPMERLFGPVMQNGYVVDDLDAALEFWTRKLQVGPFFMFEHIEFREILFRGRPTPMDITAAIAYWGDVQIELIQQQNDAPSIYQDFKRQGLRGLQHVGVLTPNLDAHLAQLEPLGLRPVQSAVASTGARVAYIDSDFHPGAMIELIESGPEITGFFALIKQAADTWNGIDATRRL